MGYPITGYTGYPLTGYLLTGYLITGYILTGYLLTGYLLTSYVLTGYLLRHVFDFDLFCTHWIYVYIWISLTVRMSTLSFIRSERAVCIKCIKCNKTHHFIRNRPRSYMFITEAKHNRSTHIVLVQNAKEENRIKNLLYHTLYMIMLYFTIWHPEFTIFYS